MTRSKWLIGLASVVAVVAVLASVAQQENAPAVDPNNPAALASSLPVGTAAPAFDVTNVVTGETLCYV